MIPKKTYPPARELAVLDQAKANRDTFPAETEHDLDLSELIVCNYTYAAETEHKWIKHIFSSQPFGFVSTRGDRIKNGWEVRKLSWNLMETYLAKIEARQKYA